MGVDTGQIGQREMWAFLRLDEAAREIEQAQMSDKVTRMVGRIHA